MLVKKTASFRCLRRIFCTFRMANKKRVPDRWKDYNPCSWTPIENERIISFKTPLAKKFITGREGDEGLIPSERFTPSDLLNELEKRDLQLGMVLDFTFTKRYYDPIEFTDRGVIYKKMMCPGHEIPKEDDIKRFEYEVHSFLEKNKTGTLVGVHCTHGINRTGYMVCRYLIDCKGYNPEDAIKAFNEARGYPIERDNYLEDLKSREPGHNIDFKEYSEELSKQENNTNESEPPKRPQKHSFRTKFPREDYSADDYVPDFIPPWKRARGDPYYDQEPQHSHRYTDEEYHSRPKSSEHRRQDWYPHYNRRNQKDRRNYQREYDRYYHGYHHSELDWYESDNQYRWQRNERNFDHHRNRYRYK